MAERFPAWSPDGKKVAYWSDRSGEYELVVRNADGSGEERILTSLGRGFRYQPYWSPDSKKIVFIDQDVILRLLDVKTAEVRKIDRGEWVSHGSLSGFSVSWSSDNRWLAYAKTRDSATSSIYLYDTQDGGVHQVTSGYYADSLPSFDPEGKYLYFVSNRPSSQSTATWIIPGCIPTQPTWSPFHFARMLPPLWNPRNDDEEIKEESNKEEDEGETGEKEQKPEAEGEEEAAGEEENKEENKGVGDRPGGLREKTGCAASGSR